jgi:hypothetical protein
VTKKGLASICFGREALLNLGNLGQGVRVCWPLVFSLSQAVAARV